jgi:hypothetical protein
MIINKNKTKIKKKKKNKDCILYKINKKLEKFYKKIIMTCSNL